MWAHRFEKFLASGIITFLIYGASLISTLAFLLFWPDRSIQIQLLSLGGLIPLYLALLISQIASFGFNEIKQDLKKIQQELITSAFFFALIHASLAFFTQLGGFKGILYLSFKYKIAISSSLIGLLLLSWLVINSYMQISSKLPKQFKKFHSLILHMAGILILFHAFQLGSHFDRFSNIVPKIIFADIAILVLLKAMQLDMWLKKKWRISQSFGIASLLSIILFFYLYAQLILPAQTYSESDLNIHAQDAQENDQLNERFGVSFIPPQQIEPNKPVRLEFTVSNSNTGEPIKLFQDLQYKVSQLIVVNDNLSHYQNIALDQYLGTLFAEVSFPANGKYHIYVDYQPFGSKEQQAAFIVQVGPSTNETTINTTQKQLESKYEDMVDGFIVKFKNPRILDAGKVFAGQEILGFDIIDEQTKKSITRVEHYLGRWGTLSIINMQTYDYIYSKMTSHSTGSYDNKKKTMILDYTPSGSYGPVRSGTYKVWLDIKLGEKIITADFIIHMR